MPRRRADVLLEPMVVAEQGRTVDVPRGEVADLERQCVERRRRDILEDEARRSPSLLHDEVGYLGIELAAGGCGQRLAGLLADRGSR